MLDLKQIKNARGPVDGSIQDFMKDRGSKWIMALSLSKSLDIIQLLPNFTIERERIGSEPTLLSIIIIEVDGENVFDILDLTPF